MERFLQAAALTLVAVILSVVLSKQSKDLAMLLSITAACLVLFAAAMYLDPILSFARKLQSIGNLNGDMMGVLMKAAGITLVAEIASLICKDSGNAALGKGIHILAAAAVLWLSLPLMEQLLDFVQKMMGGT